MDKFITNDDVRRWSLREAWETEVYRKVVISAIAKSGKPRLVLLHLANGSGLRDYICIKTDHSGDPYWSEARGMHTPGWARYAYENYIKYQDGKMVDPEFSLDEISAGAALIEELQRG